MTELTDNNYKDELEYGTRVVVFWAPWCKFCSPVKEYLKTLDDSVSTYSCNIDSEFTIAQEFNILSLPTVIVYKDNIETTRLIGTKIYDELKSAIESE